MSRLPYLQRVVDRENLAAPEARQAMLSILGGESSTAQIAAGNQNWFTRVIGESPDYFDIRQWPLALGAPFTAQDVRSANKVCVIGQTTATQVFGNDDPVGSEINPQLHAASVAAGLQDTRLGIVFQLFRRILRNELPLGPFFQTRAKPGRPTMGKIYRNRRKEISYERKARERVD